MVVRLIRCISQPARMASKTVSSGPSQLTNEWHAPPKGLRVCSCAVVFRPGPGRVPRRGHAALNVGNSGGDRGADEAPHGEVAGGSGVGLERQQGSGSFWRSLLGTTSRESTLPQSYATPPASVTMNSRRLIASPEAPYTGIAPA